VRQAYRIGATDGIASTISILEKSLERPLHKDFAMDRVIRATFVEIVASLKEYHQAYKEQAP